MVTKMLLVDGANYVLMLRGSKYTGISTKSVATRDQISASQKSSCRVLSRATLPFSRAFSTLVIMVIYLRYFMIPYWVIWHIYLGAVILPQFCYNST